MSRIARLMPTVFAPMIYSNLFPYGGLEETGGWIPVAVSYSIDSVNHIKENGCFRIERTLLTNCRIFRQFESLLTLGEYYLCSIYLKNGNCPDGIRISSLNLTLNTIAIEQSSINTNWVRVGSFITPSQFQSGGTTRIQLGPVYSASNPIGCYGYCDGLMLNKITVNDYLSGVDYCLAKYPYKSPE